MSWVESLILEAIRLFGGQADGMFNSAAFSVATRRRFDLADCLDGAWCERVLRPVPGIEQLPGGCHWRYRRPVAGPAARA